MRVTNSDNKDLIASSTSAHNQRGGIMKRSAQQRRDQQRAAQVARRALDDMVAVPGTIRGLEGTYEYKVEAKQWVLRREDDHDGIVVKRRTAAGEDEYPNSARLHDIARADIAARRAAELAQQPQPAPIQPQRVLQF